MINWFNIFKVSRNILTDVEIKNEKDRVLAKNDLEFQEKLKKDKQNIMKKIKNAVFYYSGQRCEKRENFFSKHLISLNLSFCGNPDFKEFLSEITINCSFCGRVPYSGKIRPYFDCISKFNITEKQLDILLGRVH